MRSDVGGCRLLKTFANVVKILYYTGVPLGLLTACIPHVMVGNTGMQWLYNTINNTKARCGFRPAPQRKCFRSHSDMYSVVTHVVVGGVRRAFGQLGTCGWWVSWRLALQ